MRINSERKFQHVYAIIRIDLFQENLSLRDKLHIKKIVLSEDIAKSEIERLNKLNGEKDVFYYYEQTRFFDK